MSENRNYSCVLASPSAGGEAVVHIGAAELEFQLVNRTFQLNYAAVNSFRLLNYHLFIDTAEGRYEVSRLGRDTEGFYEELWLAYALRSRQALFAANAPFMSTEGEYHYQDDGGSAQGRAKICLFPDCVCILPPDCGARRIPLCFVQEVRLVNYTVQIMLDTGEYYELIRLGHDTHPFFENLGRFTELALQQWQAAHNHLDSNLAVLLDARLEQYRFLQQLCAAENVIQGLFAPPPVAAAAAVSADSLAAAGDPVGIINDAVTQKSAASGQPPFWFCALHDAKAVVELVAAEKTAAYLYRYPEPPPVFARRLRHALEAMGLHRELIFADAAAVAAEPLYSMALQRNAHLRFLRGCLAGRIIHTEAWPQKVQDFLQAQQ